MALTLQRATDTATDPAWDAFLVSHPLGQFQQSSLWAQVKGLDGWHTVRETFKDTGRLVGGFQILFKTSRAGRIGYVSKGPVLLPEYARDADFVLGQMRKCVQDHRIRALIVQPPDDCAIFPAALNRPPFLPNRLVSIITANCVVKLDADFTAVERRMRPHTRQEVRQAVKRGVVVREGREQDLPLFFQLMLASCSRQGENHPNPGRVELLTALWHQFHPNEYIRLHMAEVGGETVSGLLSMAFGSRVTFWKKGWSGCHTHAHPNQAMQFEALRWAAAKGYKTCDFAAMGPDLARKLAEGCEPTEVQKKSRDFFNLGFGGGAALLPPARVYIPHPVVRMIYRLWTWRR